MRDHHGLSMPARQSCFDISPYPCGHGRSMARFSIVGACYSVQMCDNGGGYNGSDNQGRQPRDRSLTASSQVCRVSYLRRVEPAAGFASITPSSVTSILKSLHRRFSSSAVCPFNSLHPTSRPSTIPLLLLFPSGNG